ncbi:MAG: peptidyl-prolyl cis-trans isomerase [Verrucomicrobia bacterium]|nr:peptidyl-prolyl cis-trans isomerase [Verrucomicrobiota bacterium]
MITWIQRYFQHHFRTIFAVLLALIIISFVFTIGASPGLGHGDRQLVERHFFGYNLSLAQDQQRLMGDAGISANLQMGGFGNIEPDQLQSYAFQRATQLHLANEWHIPASTDAEITDQIKTLRMFQSQEGQFDAKAYSTFRDNLKTNPRGLTESDIKRVISDDVRAEKVTKLIGGPGYVLPGDVKTQLARSDTTWTVATASADYASFAPTLKPTDADLTKFFEEEAARFQIPPRVVATYAEFSALSYLPSVTVSEAEVRAYYDANPSRFPKAPTVKPADDKNPVKADPAADYAAARPQVEATLKLEQARKLAAKAASDLTLAIYENKVPAAGIDAFLAKLKLTAKPLAPFTREAGPAELGGSPEAAAEAFKLPREDRYYTEAVNVPTGAVVLFWKETQPARKPAFAEVREKVTADWTEGEKRRRFVDLGKTIKTQLETRLKAGDTFEQAATAAASSAGVKIETKTVAPFTLRNRPQDADYSMLGALDRLEKGQVSDMVVGQDKGLFVYALDKKAPDLTEANPQFVTMRNQIAGYTASMNARSYVSDLVQQELKKSEPKEK